MRVLILGGGGMLGHALVDQFRDEFDTWATLRGSIGAYGPHAAFDPARTLSGIDVLNVDAVTDALARVRPEVVINCVGIIKQLAAAKDPFLSVSINSLLPHRLHKLCLASGARLVHFSTDCVFSGRAGNYSENDDSDALDLYGRSKFLGETSGPGALTIRSSIIGHELANRSGLLEWFLAQRGGRIKGYRRAIYSGFTTLEMSRIVSMIIRQQPALCGTIQVSSQPISKYDLLVLARSAYAIDVEIEPDDTVVIDRSLDSTRFRQATGYAPPSWPVMIHEMADSRCSRTRLS